MNNDFYSHWLRDKKRYSNEHDQQTYNDTNYNNGSNKFDDTNFNDSNNRRYRNQQQEFYESGNKNVRDDMQHHQQYRTQKNKWQGWDNSDKVSDRNWWNKTTDEVAGWLGDEDAQRRRKFDRVRGPHRGKGPRGYERSDERIREDVSDRFYDDPQLDASDINVTVDNKDVILEGTVESKEAKRRAEYLAESIRGVKDVENRLKINRNSRDSDTRSY